MFYISALLFFNSFIYLKLSAKSPVTSIHRRYNFYPSCCSFHLVYYVMFLYLGPDRRTQNFSVKLVNNSE